MSRLKCLIFFFWVLCVLQVSVWTVTVSSSRSWKYAGGFKKKNGSLNIDLVLLLFLL